MSDISDKLAASRVEHAAYRSAKFYNQSALAKIALQKALDFRLEADAADPEHVDPAWAASEITHPHAALVSFYNEQLSRA